MTLSVTPRTDPRAIDSPTPSEADALAEEVLRLGRVRSPSVSERDALHARVRSLSADPDALADMLGTLRDGRSPVRRTSPREHLYSTDGEATTVTQYALLDEGLRGDWEVHSFPPAPSEELEKMLSVATPTRMTMGEKQAVLLDNLAFTDLRQQVIDTDFKTVVKTTGMSSSSPVRSFSQFEALQILQRPHGGIKQLQQLFSYIGHATRTSLSTQPQVGQRPPLVANFAEKILEGAALEGIHTDYEGAPPYRLMKDTTFNYPPDGRLAEEAFVRPEQITCLIYVTSEEAPRGGGTRLYSDDLSEVKSVAPRHMRVVFFDGSIKHTLAPLEEAEGTWRCSIVYKLDVRNQDPEDTRSPSEKVYNLLMPS